MAKEPVPIIREDHYKTFLAIPTRNIPDTFDKWRNARADDIAQIGKGGNIAVTIEINPDEFRLHCQQHGLAADFNAIKDLAVEKFRRQEKADAEAKLKASGSGPKKVVEISDG